MKLDQLLTAFDSLHDRPHDSARRAFLLGSLGIFALSPLEYARAAMRSPAPLSALDELLDTLGNEKHVQNIGRIFLTSEAGRQFDQQKCLKRLSRELGDDAVIHRRLAQLITGDFAHSTTVQLEGWILSRTEVELCALCTNRGESPCL